MKKIFKQGLVFAFLTALTMFSSSNSSFAYDSILKNRISDTAEKFTATNILDSDFQGQFPTNCFDSGGNAEWYLTFLGIQDPAPTIGLEGSRSSGKYPSTLEEIFDASNYLEPFYLFSGITLNQICKSGEAFALNFNQVIFPKISSSIAKDLGYLAVNQGDDLDIDVNADDNNFGSGDFTYSWDMDNNGTFETQGKLGLFSSQNLLPGDFIIKARSTSPEGFYSDSSETVTVVDFPVEIEYIDVNTIPDILAQGADGFLNPENSFVEDGITANQNGNPDTFSINYAFSTPQSPGYRIKSLKVHMRAKNTGIDPAKYVIGIGTDTRGFSNENCTEILPSNAFGDYTCSVYMSDITDSVGQILEADINFQSYDNRSEDMQVDAVWIEYVYKKVTIFNMAIDAGGPYTVAPGQQVNISSYGSGQGSSEYEYSWDLNYDGFFETQGQGAIFDASNLTDGIYSIRAKASHASGGIIIDTTTVIVEEQNNEPVTLYPTQDSYIKQGGQNENEGGSPIIRLQSSGKNRGLVQFSQEEIDEAIGISENYTATLQFTITNNGNNWGTNGRTIELHRLIAPWIEGNGYIVGNQPTFRGTGAGATWNCGIDSNTSNQTDDCSSTWEMTNSSAWPFITNPTATSTITNAQEGIVEFDVTGDIQEFMNGSDNFGWIIKKTDEGANGKVEFSSREANNTPKLVISFY